MLKQLDLLMIDSIWMKADVIDSPSFEHTGNMTAFLEIERKNGSRHFAWSMGTHQDDIRIAQLYNELIALTGK